MIVAGGNGRRRGNQGTQGQDTCGEKAWSHLLVCHGASPSMQRRNAALTDLRDGLGQERIVSTEVPFSTGYALLLLHAAAAARSTALAVAAAHRSAASGTEDFALLRGIAVLVFRHILQLLLGHGGGDCLAVVGDLQIVPRQGDIAGPDAQKTADRDDD